MERDDTSVITASVTQSRTDRPSRTETGPVAGRSRGVEHWSPTDADSLSSWLRMESLAPWVLQLGLLALMTVLFGAARPEVLGLAWVSVVAGLGCGSVSLHRIRSAPEALSGHALDVVGICLCALATAFVVMRLALEHVT